MHPAALYWWKYGRRHADWGAWAGCGPAVRGGGWDRHEASGSHHGEYASGAFGVRRPLRFLAYKLQLDETQVGELARILDELKTERAQAEVDGRRTVSALADAISGDSFDSASSAIFLIARSGCACGTRVSGDISINIDDCFSS